MNTTPCDDDLIRRGIAAYFKYTHAPEIADPVAASASTVEKREGRTYIVLRNSARVLAVYRLKPDGLLKKLRRISTFQDAGAIANNTVSV